MFIHQNIEYYIGHCHGKFLITIPSLEIFKEYEAKKWTEADVYAKNLITNYLENGRKQT